MERRHCGPDDRCPDMVRVMTWGKATRYFMGGGMITIVLAAIVSLFVQYKGLTEITKLRTQFESFQEVMLRKVRLMDYDGQRTRAHVNKIGKQVGVEPIEVRSFNPPTFEDMVQNYKKENGE